jgi:hypothetical protein
MLHNFFRLFHIKVSKDKEAYLLTELLEDLKKLSQDQDLDEPPVMKAFTLKQILKEQTLTGAHTTHQTTGTIFQAQKISTLSHNYMKVYHSPLKQTLINADVL